MIAVKSRSLRTANDEYGRQIGRANARSPTTRRTAFGWRRGPIASIIGPTKFGFSLNDQAVSNPFLLTSPGERTRHRFNLALRKTKPDIGTLNLPLDRG
jgi:hypothetical protein